MKTTVRRTGLRRLRLPCPPLARGLGATVALAVLIPAAPRLLAAADATALRAATLPVIQPLPDQAPGAEKDSAALVALGKALYFEKRLSSNESQSCNSCHQVDEGKAGVDNEATSDGALGQKGNRNSPTVWNSALQFAQFWDGRAPTLEEQAKGPVLNPVEMAMPTEAEVMKRLKATAGYPEKFKAAFPGAGEPMTYDHMARAIAAFERTLISHDSLDAFLKGQDSALKPQEQEGLKLFVDVGCTTCHNGPLVGGNAYHKVGLVNPYENKADLGRMAVTKEEDDQFKFKVPTLRNVALTGPYFHDGRVAHLNEAIQKMAWMQLGRELSDPEVQALVGFLKTLSGRGLKAVEPGAAG